MLSVLVCEVVMVAWRSGCEQFSGVGVSRRPEFETGKKIPRQFTGGVFWEPGWSVA